MGISADFRSSLKQVRIRFLNTRCAADTDSAAKWQNATRPISPAERKRDAKTPEERSRAASDAARANWKRVGEIARRAGGDDPEDPSEDEEEMEASRSLG